MEDKSYVGRILLALNAFKMVNIHISQRLQLHLMSMQKLSEES